MESDNEEALDELGGSAPVTCWKMCFKGELGNAATPGNGSRPKRESGSGCPVNVEKLKNLDLLPKKVL